MLHDLNFARIERENRPGHKTRWRGQRNQPSRTRHHNRWQKDADLVPVNKAEGVPNTVVSRSSLSESHRFGHSNITPVLPLDKPRRFSAPSPSLSAQRHSAMRGRNSVHGGANTDEPFAHL